MDTERAPDDNTSPSRRTFLTGAGAAALAGLAATSCSTDELPSVATDTSENTTSLNTQSNDGSTPNESDAPTPPLISAVPFGGAHQQAILVAPQAAGLVAAFDAIATTRTELIDAMQALSTEIDRLMAARPIEAADEFLPPIDSGAVGAESSTAGIAISVAVGASLFDGRFGLADQQPTELIVMPQFFNDRQVRTDLSHGDFSITVSAPNHQLAIYGLHQIVRVTERRLRLRWVQEGYNQLLAPSPDQVAPSRNLMGFRDGTSNLDSTNTDIMNEHVWVHPDDGEPSWASGGSYQAVRIIRMLIEFWATAASVRQEQIFGRHRDTGAPLGQDREDDEPFFAGNPADESVPRRAHMRLANPRTPGTGRILRRGFSYLNGADGAGTLDQGLLFTCYQRRLTTGFLEVQSRLEGEPLEDYIKPVGGGLFFVLPGPGPGDGWLGESLFA